MVQAGEVTIARGWLERHPEGTLKEAQEDGVSEEAFRAAQHERENGALAERSPKMAAALEWVRAHPDADYKEAARAGLAINTFKKARGRYIQEGHPKHRGGRTRKDGSKAGSNGSNGVTLPAIPPGIPTTKIGKLMLWLSEHPGAGVHDAVAAGHTMQNYYAGKRRMEGRATPTERVRHRSKQAPTPTALVHRDHPVSIRAREPEDGSPGNEALIRLIRTMQDELGVEELYFRRGVLEYVQRRQVRIT